MDAGPTTALLERVLVPVADAEDAAASANALAPYDPETVIVCYVVEKGGGVPDKTPVEQSEDIAEEAFGTFRDTFPEAVVERRYDRDVVAAIFDAAADREVTAVAFRPRGGSRLARLITGDRTLRLVTETDRPVIALPDRT